MNDVAAAIKEYQDRPTFVFEGNTGKKKDVYYSYSEIANAQWECRMATIWNAYFEAQCARVISERMV